MEVTKKNFRQVLAELDDVFDKCDFVAIDCEFTGLLEENTITPFDYPEDVYHKSRINSSEFIVIQMGLTAVKIFENDQVKKLKLNNNCSSSSSSSSNNKNKTTSNNDKKFVYKSYNFYIFPRSRKTVRCQGSCLTFLAEKGLNFNKLFQNGISYCDETKQHIMKNKLLQKQKQREDSLNSNSNDSPNLCNHIPVPDEEKKLIEDINQSIEEFLTSNDNEKLISNCNGFQRKLIYEMLEAKYYKKVTASTKLSDDNQTIIVIRKKLSLEEEKLIENDKRHLEQIELENYIGMSLVLQKLSKSKKLIVGHNMLLDIIFIIRQFFDQLPEKFCEFKKRVQSLFPKIMDTKYMTKDPKLKNIIKSNVLEHLVQTLSEKSLLPKFECETSVHEYSQSNKKHHEAGYDSYLTAIAFLGLAKFFNSKFEKNLDNDVVLKPFLNKIFLMNIEGISYMNMTEKEPIPSRDYVFHVRFPETWSQLDLVNRFKKFGPIFIKWLNATNAIVSLHNRDQSHNVIQTIEMFEGFEIDTFCNYRCKSLPQILSSCSLYTLPSSSSTSSSSSALSLIDNSNCMDDSGSSSSTNFDKCSCLSIENLSKKRKYSEAFKNFTNESSDNMERITTEKKIKMKITSNSNDKQNVKKIETTSSKNHNLTQHIFKENDNWS